MGLLDKIAEEGRRQKLQSVPVHTGPALRDEALDRVERHATDEFKTAAFAAVNEIASMRSEFTTDAIWHLLGEKANSTHERRALGAVMTTAAKRGVCVSTDRTVKSTRPDCHARPVRVWRSLIYEAREAA